MKKISNLLGPMIGVILGLFLNKTCENIQLNKARKIAIERVWAEVEENENLLILLNEQITKKFKAYSVIDWYLNESGKIIVPTDSLQNFKKQVVSALEIDSIVSYSRDSLKISGTLDLMFGSKAPAWRLKEIYWTSFKRQPDYLKKTDLSTIAKFERIYLMQNECNRLMKVFFDILFSFNIEDLDYREKFLKQWSLLVMHQWQLLQFYNMEIRNGSIVSGNQFQFGKHFDEADYWFIEYELDTIYPSQY